MTETRSIFTLETPEHVALHLHLAEVGTRLVACLIDLILVAVVVSALAVVLVLAGVFGRDLVAALVLLAMFLLRTFYFMVGEVRGRGQTFGKRKCGVRVVAADGGPLSAEQVVARNLTREFEIFLPITVLLAGGNALPQAPFWAQWALIVWICGLAALPLLNRRRARLGDLLAGTLVVVEPGGALDLDLADSGRVEPEFRFTKAQLDIYGIKELQVLEDVLHRPDSSARTHLLHGILDRVVQKIDWSDSVPYVRAESFLHAFYSAQRHRLEHRMLLGERREEKVR